MNSQLGAIVSYHLPLGEKSVDMNRLLGKTITMTFTGNIHCIQCGKKTKKSFQQGFCYLCFRRIGECGNCMLFPERCRAQHGGCDPNDWVHASCLQEHVVYLANSSTLKVGITRASQIPTRWIDQGAVQALPIFKTRNRYQAGMVEKLLIDFVNDKTNWRAMLSGVPVELNLIEEKEKILRLADESLQRVIAQFDDGDVVSLSDSTPISICFPITLYPTKFSTFNFEKDPIIKGVLAGIKGQYLIFEQGLVNVRKFGGYEIEFQS